MINNTVGKNIKYFRLNMHMTQEQLAKKLCMKRQTLSNYEIGARIPDVYLLSTMADIFDTTIDAIVGRTEPENK